MIRTLDLEHLSLSSYTRLCTMISVCLGFVTGIIFFSADMLGANTAIQIGIIRLPHIESGIVALFLSPFIFCVVGFVGSLFSYQVFLWALRTFWGLELIGRWKDVSGTAIHHSDSQIGANKS